jgi:hypothetical protein
VAAAGSQLLGDRIRVPNDMLGAGPEIGVWATISLRRDGTLVQMDRGGHPSINPIINPDDVNNQYNTGEPATDVETHLTLWTKSCRPAAATRLRRRRPRPPVLCSPTSCV